MFKFTRYSMFDGVQEPIETDVFGAESGPRISLVVRRDHNDDQVIEELDRLVAHVRARLTYDPLDSIF